MPETLLTVLARQAAQHPDRLFTRFLTRGEIAASLTYSQAWGLAGRWAALLLERGPLGGPGQPVLLALPNTPDFVGAYFGILRAGGVPAPISPVRTMDDASLAAHYQRMDFLGANILVLPNDSPLPPGSRAKRAPLPSLLTARDLPPEGDPPLPPATESDLAHLQFTSGTTGRARAVMLSHAALLWQTRAISRALQLEDRDRDWAVSWLPLHHDMGLIGFLLTPMIHAGHVTLLAAEDFVLRPGLWLKALTDFKATITGGPPSAYALCARRIKDSDTASFDLSHLRIALVGAEMIAPDVLRDFAEKFAPTGFRASALLPTYGLAENALDVTLTRISNLKSQTPRGASKSPTHPVTVSPGHPVTSPAPLLPAPPAPRISLGPPLPDLDLAIVDDAGHHLPDGAVGEIILRSPSVMMGYYNDEEATCEVLRDGWLWTGDLGYITGGELTVTGRKKEAIIVGGRNYSPHDLERAAASVEGVRASARVIAVSRFNESLSTDEVFVLAETALTAEAERAQLRQAIRLAVTQAGFPLTDVILLPPKTIQSTPSGKVRRVEWKERLDELRSHD